MPKRRVLKNRNDEEQEQPQRAEEEQQQSTTSTNDEPRPPKKMIQLVNGQQKKKEYHYRTTVKSYEELDKFRIQNCCRFTVGIRRRHTFMSLLTIPCTRQKSRKHCDFELKAYRPSADSGNIHVYAHSQHNHPLQSQSSVKRPLHRKEKELMPDNFHSQVNRSNKKPKRRVLKNRNDEEQEQEQPQQQEQHLEEEQQQSPSTNELQLQQPKKKITQFVNGQQKEYHYRTTVKSYEELDKFRFQNYCSFTDVGRRHTFTSLSLPCTRKRQRKNCDFELKAFRSSDSGNIHVYAFSHHNHPLISNEDRLLCKGAMELVPDEKPPTIYRTSDDIEWTFFQTSPDYDTFSKFRLKNNCKYRGNTSDESSRIRCYCVRRWQDDKCKFMLLALKTTKQRYHVYSYGEHNHPVHNLKTRQKSSRGKQKSRQEEMEDEKDGEESMEEEQEQEDEPIDGEQNAEDIAQPEQDEQMETDDSEEYSKKCQRRLESNLHKYGMVRTKKWMRRIDQSEIGRIIAEMEIKNVANLMSMADTDIGIFEETLPFWLPWMKKAIRKRRSELVEFVMEFNELLKVESLPDKLKQKIQKMLDKRRLEIEAKKNGYRRNEFG